MKIIPSPYAKALIVLVLGAIGVAIQWINTGYFNAPELQTILATAVTSFVVWLTKNIPSDNLPPTTYR